MYKNISVKRFLNITMLLELCRFIFFSANLDIIHDIGLYTHRANSCETFATSVFLNI